MTAALRALLAAFLLLPVATHALVFRAYLASDGNDANPCTLLSPCRLLPAALTVVQPGGEIWMLDSANYNTATVVVAKSVTILAIPGAVGSVVATGGPAFSISDAGLVITLRNLVMVPLSSATATHGVHLTGASTVTVENSTITNMPGMGIFAEAIGAVTRVIGSTISGSAGWGVVAMQGASADLQGSKLLGNGNGVLASAGTPATSTVTVTDCLISGGNEGVYASTFSSPGADARIVVTRSTIIRTNHALHAYTDGTGTAAVVASYTTVAHNGMAWSQSGLGSAVYTLGNNHVSDNTSSFGSLSPLPLQ